MKEARAFSPCHITGFFQIFDQSSNSLYSGSRGAGVSLSRGVETIVMARKVLKSSLHININGHPSNTAEVSKSVVDDFCSRFEEMQNHKIFLEHHVELPIGAGFGTSGAAALSLALALNKAFDLGMSRTDAAQLAHLAEVECKTGLGTVIAETFGGVEIRVKPGAPGIGEVKHVPILKDYVVVCLTFDSLPTKKFLTDNNMCEHINKFGGKLVDKLIRKANVTNLMRFSRQFIEEVGLISAKTRKILNEAENANFTCSMPVFGESIFAMIERKSIQELLNIFFKYGSEGKIVVSEIDFEGARLIK